jgi:hypothetical protein
MVFCIFVGLRSLALLGGTRFGGAEALTALLAPIVEGLAALIALTVREVGVGKTARAQPSPGMSPLSRPFSNRSGGVLNDQA